MKIPGPHNGLLSICAGGQTIEIVNDARAAAYLSNPDLALDNVSICDIVDFAGCRQNALVPDENFVPEEMGDLGGVITDEDTTDPVEGALVTATLVSPALPYVIADWTSPQDDPAPWYKANYPESADALGFFVEEWTGLDDAPIRRATTEIGNFGVQHGPRRVSGRVMALNMLMFARSERAMDYLFTWLSTTLTNACSDCGTNRVIFRRFCDDTEDDPTVGLAELREVALTRGLQWEADPMVRRGKCFIRRVSFVITAGDPCKYLAGTDVELDETNHLEPDIVDCLMERWEDDRVRPNRRPCRPSCSELGPWAVGGCRDSVVFESDTVGASAPVITWYNGEGEHTIPFRARVYEMPGGGASIPNPCSLPLLGELYVRPIPPYSWVQWDVAARKVRFRDVTTGTFEPGYAAIAPNDPPHRRDFVLRCGTAVLVVEPADLCAERIGATGNTFSWDGLELQDPHLPEVEISVVERVGCS